MDVSELIEQLEALADEYGDDCEVQIATQPEYPLAYTIAGVTAIDPADAATDSEEFGGEPAGAPVVVWLASGEQPAIPYAPSAAWHVKKSRDVFANLSPAVRRAEEATIWSTNNTEGM